MTLTRAKSIQTNISPTTFELAQQQHYSTSAINALKRPHHEAFPERGQVAHEPGKDSDCLEHPRLALQPNRLQASRIVDPHPTEYEDGAPNVSEYTQRRIAASTPTVADNSLLSLSHARYGLPPLLLHNLTALGVHSIYPWQSACLLGKGLLGGTQNLIYTAPTGGGKSLVADLLLLKRVIEEPTKKALIVLPYVALVQEKLKWLRKVTEGVTKNMDQIDAQPFAANSRPKWKQPHSNITVAGFFGGSRSKLSWTDIDIAICTIEKANSLINAAIEEGRVDQLGAVVLDELHMLHDEHRGYILELMVSKLMFMDETVQIVGMSATLSNPQALASWLQAKYYVSGYRPIPIDEYIVYGGSIYPTANAKDFFRTASQVAAAADGITERLPEADRTISKSSHRELEEPTLNAVVSLAVETANRGYGALVFCSSRRGTESTASVIADAMPTHHEASEVLNRRMEIIAALQSLSSGFEPLLSKTIPGGVAFHHAGLTVEERELLAEAYDAGVLKIMVATCSLAAGVNLPARRVILYGARMGRELIGPAMLRQMRGRAGRKGRDEIGESYLCCQKSDLEAIAQLLEAEMPPVESCLTSEKKGLTRALLEAIATRLATTIESLEAYVKCSLLWGTTNHETVLAMFHKSVKELLEMGLIEQAEYDVFEPSKMGSAVVASSLTPEDGIFVHNEMRRALESFVMDGDMHIFYMFTPVQTTGLSDMSWPMFRQQLESLDESGIRALRCVGINPALVNRLANSGAKLKENTPEEIMLARTYRRAYSAFQLRDICNEIPIHDISLKYSVPRGAVQNLAQTCHGFAAGMIKFCERMGWGMLAAVLDHMVDRLRAGARADLLEMAQVTFVKSRMARILWENGFKSVRALAEADANELVPIMIQAQIRGLRMQGEAANKLRQKLLEKAEIIVSSANQLWERQQLAELED